MDCPTCKIRGQVDNIKANRHAEHVQIGSVLIAEEPDRTVLRIYKPMSADHRRRLLDLARDVENHAE